jgi:hypothetical protein
MWVQIISFSALWKGIVTHYKKTGALHEDRARNGDRAGKHHPFSKI